MGMPRAFSVVLFSFILLFSFSIVSVSEVDAAKSSGTRNSETGSDKVCGDKLCSEVEEEQQVGGVSQQSAFMVGGVAQQESLSSATIYDGIEFPDGDISFADYVVDYDNLTSGGPAPTDPNYLAPHEALGAPDYVDPYGSVSLGNGGSIVLRFTDNLLTGSGDYTPDLHIFEIGPNVEDTFVAISSDGVTWVDVGKVYGSTDSIDLDAFGFNQNHSFSFVMLIDDSTEGSTTGKTVGADIDAVGAISTYQIEPVDSDGDGIPDYEDVCPHDYYDECDAARDTHYDVDSDGDGIPDHSDECPDEYGTVTSSSSGTLYGGCPDYDYNSDYDSDRDGIEDQYDECPEDYYNLCDVDPHAVDSDGDGIPDHSDECPDEYGDVTSSGGFLYGGCPDVINSDDVGYSDTRISANHKPELPQSGDKITIFLDVTPVDVNAPILMNVFNPNGIMLDTQQAYITDAHPSDEWAYVTLYIDTTSWDVSGEYYVSFDYLDGYAYRDVDFIYIDNPIIESDHCYGSSIELDQKQYYSDDLYYVTLVAPNENYDSDVVENVSVMLWDVNSGRHGGAALEETGTDTGIFTNTGNNERLSPYMINKHLDSIPTKFKITFDDPCTGQTIDTVADVVNSETNDTNPEHKPTPELVLSVSDEGAFDNIQVGDTGFFDIYLNNPSDVDVSKTSVGISMSSGLEFAYPENAIGCSLDSSTNSMTCEFDEILAHYTSNMIHVIRILDSGTHKIDVEILDVTEDTDLSNNFASFEFTVYDAKPDPTPEPTTPGKDTVPPHVIVPSDKTVDAGTSDSVKVEYSVSAVDNVDEIITPVCNPKSGSEFKTGTTEVKCTATDSSGNSASDTFTVTVKTTKDTTPPKLTVPDDMTIDAGAESSVKVVYSISATDDVDRVLIPQCTPESGSEFKTGTTEVKCTATDSSGNTSIATFKVTVNTTATVIPGWVKDVGQLWCDDQIEDDGFVGAIAYLIDNGIIIVQVESVGGDSSGSVPSWIKNNACLWSQGILSDEEFAAGIKYLIQQGVIKLSA